MFAYQTLQMPALVPATPTWNFSRCSINSDETTAKRLGCYYSTQAPMLLSLHTHSVTAFEGALHTSK